MNDPTHYGILGDAVLRSQNLDVVALDPSLMLCARCGGTGNEFYAMYRQCPQCGGIGVVDREVDGNE